ncbi:MAG: hypothetical protein LVR00_04975 [Rhabdochlamydiaceae bacterium]
MTNKAPPPILAFERVSAQDGSLASHPLCRAFRCGVRLANEALDARVYSLFIKNFWGVFMIVAGLLPAIIGKFFELRIGLFRIQLTVKKPPNDAGDFFERSKYFSATRAGEGIFTYALHPTTKWTLDWVPIKDEQEHKRLLGTGVYLKPGEGSLKIDILQGPSLVGILETQDPLFLGSRNNTGNQGCYAIQCANFGLFGIVIPQGTQLKDSGKTESDILFIPLI